MCFVFPVIRLQRKSADRKKFSPPDVEKWNLVPKICRVSKKITARWTQRDTNSFILVFLYYCVWTCFQLFSAGLFMFPLRVCASLSFSSAVIPCWFSIFAHFNKLLIMNNDYCILLFPQMIKKIWNYLFFKDLFQ